MTIAVCSKTKVSDFYKRINAFFEPLMLNGPGLRYPHQPDLGIMSDAFVWSDIRLPAQKIKLTGHRGSKNVSDDQTK